MNNELSVSGLINILKDLNDKYDLYKGKVVINCDGSGKIEEEDGSSLLEWTSEEHMYVGLFEYTQLEKTYQRDLAKKYNNEQLR